MPKKTKKVNISAKYIIPAKPKIGCLGILTGGWALGAKLARYDIAFALDSCKNIRKRFNQNIPTAIVKPHNHPISELPRPDIVAIADERNEWAWEIIKKIKPKAIVFEVKDLNGIRKLDDYETYEDNIKFWLFRVPIRRIFPCVVMLRKDTRWTYPYNTEPFPWNGYGLVTAKDILEKRPDLVKDFKFKQTPLIVEPNELFPHIRKSQAREGTRLMVRAPEGLRPATVLEAKRAMGFPDDWVLPNLKHGVFNLFEQEIAPPVAKEIYEEIYIWLA